MTRWLSVLLFAFVALAQKHSDAPSHVLRAATAEVPADGGADFGSYITAALKKVVPAAERLQPDVPSWPDLEAKVSAPVQRDGTIRKVTIVSGSGVEAFDRSLVAALSIASPLDSLPPAYRGDSAMIVFTFRYHVPR